MTFKERLRTEIEYKGMSVKEIASAAGISNNTLLSYIDSRGYLPNVETAVKIASVLGVSVEYLVTGKTPSGTACFHGIYFFILPIKLTFLISFNFVFYPL